MFNGIGVALVTPFKSNGDIDFESLERLVEHVIDGGVHFLVALGTTGETPVLDQDEKLAIASHIKTVNAGRLPLVIGFGGNNTAALCKSISEFNFDGFDGILSASPQYNKPSQEGIIAHYEELSAISPRPIILYNVPGRTSSNMLSSTTLEIARRCENVLAIKEASGNLDQCTEIALDKEERFALISGDDTLTLPMLSIGGNGAISVIANAYPKSCAEMYEAFRNGDTERAEQMHLGLYEITKAIFADGNPGGIKYLLSKLDITGETLRLPLVSVNETTRSLIQNSML